LKKIIIINCCGNILSLTRAIQKFEKNFLITSDLNEIKNATHIFLPGVGAFKKAMDTLAKKNLINLLKDLNYKKINLMGICLGMQILFDTSEENGLESGLGLIKGDVKKIVLSKQDRLNKLKIPNIGWHNIIINNKSKIFNDIEKNFNCYFVHSYHVKLKNLNECLADIDYGSNQLTSIVKKDNIYGCQFHPEKSGIDGLKIIKNFLDLG
jgi:imidazole glycerol-phosphate synthase subunit HisH